MATFPSITPTYGQQKRSAPNTRIVRFADGYEHRILFGLAAHQNPKIFNLTFNVSETDADTIEGFLGLFGNMFGGAASNAAPFITEGVFDTGFDTSLISAGAFANGGRPPVGRPSIVGERGAELFVPDRAGTIIPNHELGGSTNIVVNVDASGSNVEGDEDEGRALGIALSAAIETELIKQKRPGGLLA